MKGLTGLFSVSQSAKGSVLGDSVAEWSARRSRNPGGSRFKSRFGTCWICSRSSRVQTSATFVNSQLVASCRLGFLIILLRYISIIFF